jgi:ribosomal subunit interface protein
VRIQITERRCDVPRAVLQRAEAQVAALSKYEERATAADVVFTDDKHERGIEVNIHIDGAEAVMAHGEGTDFRSALDQAIERLRRMLRKQRERRRDHQAPPLSEAMEIE